MPYQSTADLPDRVRENLPEHAEEIYKDAFNSAYQQYQDRQKRQDEKEDVETVAHKVAWAAVKKVYEKNDQGEWVKKEGRDYGDE